MIKNILVYILIIGVLFFLGVNSHRYFIEKISVNLQFSLQNVYMFNAIFSLVVCTVFLILSEKESIFEKLGFLYLGTLVFKIILFYAVFYNPVFTAQDLTKIERISLLIPIAIFLSVEVYFIARILSRK